MMLDDEICAIGARIRERLEQLDLSEAELSRRVGMAPQNVNAALRALPFPGSRRFPSLDTISRIAAGVGIYPKIEVTMQKRPRVIALYNRGGGQGKTTTTMNLAYALAEQGHRVIALDGDGQASLTKWLGIDPRALAPQDTIEHLGVSPGTHPLPPVRDTGFGFTLVPASEDGLPRISSARIEPDYYGRLRRSLDNADCDFVLIDCPPDDASPLSKMLLTAADELIVPLNASTKGMEGVDGALRALESVRYSNPHLKVIALVVTNYMPRQQAQRLYADTLRNEHGARFPISAPITNSALYERAAADLKPVLAYLRQPDIPVQRSVREEIEASYADLVRLIAEVRA
jgi:chromosome partitioning protein